MIEYSEINPEKIPPYPIKKKEKVLKFSALQIIVKFNPELLMEGWEIPSNFGASIKLIIYRTKEQQQWLDLYLDKITPIASAFSNRELNNSEVIDMLESGIINKEYLSIK